MLKRLLFIVFLIVLFLLLSKNFGSRSNLFDEGCLGDYGVFAATKTSNLNQQQARAITKIENSIKNGLKTGDYTGTIKDMMGNPVPKPSGGYWDQLTEMQNTLRGLSKNAEILKGINNPEAMNTYNKANTAIKSIEDAIKGMGL
jgi:hypothetical protein